MNPWTAYGIPTYIAGISLSHLLSMCDYDVNKEEARSKSTFCMSCGFVGAPHLPFLRLHISNTSHNLRIPCIIGYC